MPLVCVASERGVQCLELLDERQQPRDEADPQPTRHQIVAGRLGLTETAYRYLEISAFSDLWDVYGNSAEGMHAAALGGTWQGVIGGLAGTHARRDALCFTPHLPAKWRALEFTVVWRGLLLDVTIDKRGTSVHCQAPARKTPRTRSVTIEVDGERRELRRGETVRFSHNADRKRKIETRGLFGGES